MSNAIYGLLVWFVVSAILGIFLGNLFYLKDKGYDNLDD